MYENEIKQICTNGTENHFIFMHNKKLQQNLYIINCLIVENCHFLLIHLFQFLHRLLPPHNLFPLHQFRDPRIPFS